MTLTRIAVAVCICCVGVMLFAACGLPLPQPPTVESQRFVVTQQDGAGHTTLAAFGGFGGGDLQHMYGFLTLKYPDCVEPASFSLTGALNVRDRRIKLAGDRASGVAIDGTATFGRNGSTYVDLHVSGTMTRPAGCHDTTPVQVPFNPTPFVPLVGVFKASASLPDGKTLDLSVALHDFSFDSRGHYAGQSRIDIAGSSCFREGTVQVGRGNFQSLPATSFSEVYRMDDGSVLIAVIARPAWLGSSLPLTLPTSFTVAGGACDKQTFAATLLPAP